MKLSDFGNTSKTRNQYVDIWRLIAALIIVVLHSYHLEGWDSGKPFMSGKIFVEFFFVLTGFFTTKFSTGNNNISIKDAMNYAYRKYKPLWYYTFPYVLLVFFIRSFLNGSGINFRRFLNALLEGLLIIKGSNVGQLWYLVALLPLIPFFLFISSKIPTKLWIIIECVTGIHFYLVYCQYPSHFPVFYYRAFAGLCMGGIAYFLTTCLNKLPDLVRVNRVIITDILSITGNCILLFIVFGAYTNSLDFRVAVAGFVIGLSLILSGNRECKTKAMKLVSDLGRVYSFSIYVVHLPIADFTAYLFKEHLHQGLYFQFCFYVLSSILIAVIYEIIITRCMKKLYGN